MGHAISRTKPSIVAFDLFARASSIDVFCGGGSAATIDATPQPASRQRRRIRFIRFSLPVTSIAEFGDLRWRSYSKNFFESTPGRLKKLDIPKTDAMSPGHKASTGLAGCGKTRKYVIPNPVRFLNGVRNLLFPWFPCEQQIPHPQTTRVRDDKSDFFRSLLGCDHAQVRFVNLGLAVDLFSHSSTSVQIDRFRRGVHVLTLSSPIGP